MLAHIALVIGALQLVALVAEVEVEGGEKGASVDALLVVVWRILTQWSETWRWGLKLVAGGEDW